MELRVEYCGDEFAGPIDGSLTFGRQADIGIDDANRFLHRVIGKFRFSQAMWWLDNAGSAITLTLVDSATPSTLRLTPGTTYPIAFESSTVRFEAGGARYELEVDLIDLPATWWPSAHPPTDLDTDDLSIPTQHPGDVALSPEQFVLLTTLARSLFNNSPTRPTNRQLAHELGWTITKYNRKLDALCQKFAASGLTGLHGSSDRLAKDRRWRLAEHAVEAGLVHPEPNTI